MQHGAVLGAVGIWDEVHGGRALSRGVLQKCAGDVRQVRLVTEEKCYIGRCCAWQERNPPPSVHLRDAVREAAQHVVHLDGNELLQITDEGCA